MLKKTFIFLLITLVSTNSWGTGRCSSYQDHDDLVAIIQDGCIIRGTFIRSFSTKDRDSTSYFCQAMGPSYCKTEYNYYQGKFVEAAQTENEIPYLWILAKHKMTPVSIETGVVFYLDYLLMNWAGHVGTSNPLPMSMVFVHFNTSEQFLTFGQWKELFKGLANLEVLESTEI